MDAAPDNLINNIYDKLLSHYGDPHWWPARTPYEVIVGAVLTQNTAWENVEKAIARFGDRLSPAELLSVSDEELSDIIRPAGFFNQKTRYLKAVTEWYGRYGFSVDIVRGERLDKLRAELLSVKGVGSETADSILLYAFGLPTFVVDAYTFRLCDRLPIDARRDYASVKRAFESRLPCDAAVYNIMHALIVVNAKTHCKKKPLCGGCPLCSLPCIYSQSVV